MSKKITLIDIDNRDGDGAPYEFTKGATSVCGYLDGPLRRDLRDATGLDEAIAHVRAGDLDAANAILNKRMSVYLRCADTTESETI